MLLLDRQDRLTHAGTPDGDGRADGWADGDGRADGSANGDDLAGPGPGGQPLELGRHRAEIDQATGMLTEQLGVSIDEALSGCAPTLMLMTGASLTSLAIWSAGRCGSDRAARLRTVQRDPLAPRVNAGRSASEAVPACGG